MSADQTLQLGPLQLPVFLLVLIIGLIISTFFSEKLARNRGWEKDKWSDLIISLTLAFILIYKFGWAIFDLKRVIQNPALLIWSSGSTSSIILAVIVMVGIFLFKYRKERYPLIDVLDFVWMTIVITLFTYNLFIMDYGKTTNFITGIKIDGNSNFLYHPVNWYRTVWLGILLLIRFFVWKEMNKSRLMYLFILLGFGLLLISVFDISVNLVYGFTVAQLAYLGLTIVGIIGLLKKS